MDWEDKLLIALWNHSCADKSVPAIASEDFDFLGLENFIRKMKDKGIHSLLLADLIMLDSAFVYSSKPTEPTSWAKVQKSPQEYATLHLPSEKRLKRMASKFTKVDTLRTAQAVRAKSGNRSQESIRNTFDAGKPMFESLYQRFPNRHLRFKGLVKLKVVIHPLGHVVDGTETKCEIKYPDLPLEMIRIIQSMNFGRVHARNNEIVTFSYRFYE
jgi:hypothetical protein